MSLDVRPAFRYGQMKKIIKPHLLQPIDRIIRAFNRWNCWFESALMKYSLRSLGMTLIVGILLGGSIPSGRAADAANKTTAPLQTGVLVPVDATIDKTWLAKARSDYPLTHCLVCGDKLDSDGKSPEYVYRQSGKPDRLIRFCDEEECVVSFEKGPEKYLKVIDNAAAKASAPKN
jgi:hypothetical protein